MDLNSIYLYFLIGVHFSETSAVVEQDSTIVGFTSAYLLPDKKDHLFIWQVAVQEQERGKGLAGSMLEEIFFRSACRNIRFLEATVTVSNKASRQLFNRFALKREAPCHEEIFLKAESFGEAVHEEEIRLIIGPFKQ